jgi:hypothetical protein
MSARAEDSRNTNTAYVAFIFLIVISAFFFRSWFASDILPPPGRMQGETTQAYRYSSMISEGEPVPSTDIMVMHPEGMNTGENSIFEEYIAGWLHALTGGDFNAFMRFFCIVFPLLAIPGLILWMQRGGIPSRSALLGGAAYGILLPALLRTRGESLYRETVALPLLVWMGWSVESALATGKKIHVITSALLLFAALAAWKVTGFMSAFLFFYLLHRSCRRKDVSPFLAGILAATQILASLILSHMRYDLAILSPATVLAFFLLLSIFLKKSYIPWAGLLTALAAGLTGSSNTGHLGAVIMAKLRFFFSHPADPSLLDPDARLFWVSGYTSPLPGEIILLFGLPILIAVTGMRRFVSEYGKTLLLWFLPVAFVGYLFFDRLHVMLALALIPPLALVMKRYWKPVAVLLLLALQTVFVTTLARGIDSAGLETGGSGSLLRDDELDSLFEWIGDTEPGDAILSFWHISGLISAYAERPVVTHTFFENERNRRTIIEFAERIFQPEDSLSAFMRMHDADYIVYQADFILDRSSAGLLYLSGLMEVPDNCVALRMHYAPETLDSLRLVFQGASLRVFRRGGDYTYFLPQPLFKMRYYPFFSDYDAAMSALVFPGETAWNLAWEGRETAEPDMISAALLLASGSGAVPGDAIGILQELVMFHLAGRYEMEYLEEDFLVYLHYYGPDSALRLDLARLLVSEGFPERAAVQYREVLSEDPSAVQAAIELEQLLAEGVSE